MPLGLAALLAVIGVAALILGGLCKDKKKQWIALCVAGALIFLAASAYIILAFIFLNAV